MLEVTEDFKSTLSREDLATVSVSSCVKRLDTKAHLYQVQQVPRKKASTALEEFIDVCNVCVALAAANGGKPPIAIAYDNHLSFSTLNLCLLGQLTPDELEDIPFFKHCSPAENKVSLPFFPFKTMWFHSRFPVFGSNDPKHVLKALARQLRTAGRTVHMPLASKAVKTMKPLEHK